MTILNTYPETLTNAQKYALILSPKTQKMKDAKGSVLEISAWCHYTDAASNGEEREILAVLTPDGESFATNSATFVKDFLKMVDLFGDELRSIEVISGTSKTGREYITCAYVG